MISMEMIVSEIIGLVFGYIDIDLVDNDFLLNFVKFDESLIGECIILYGWVFDENVWLVLNMFIEIW